MDTCTLGLVTSTPGMADKSSGRMPVLVAGAITVCAVGVLVARHRWVLEAQDLQILAFAAVPWLLLLVPGLMRSLGVKEVDVLGFKVTVLEDRVGKQDAKIGEQEAKIRDQQRVINDIVVYGLAYYLVDMLREFRRLKQRADGEYIYRKNDERAAWNLRYLRDHGLIGMIKIGELVDRENILPKINLTPAGDLLLDLRNEYESRRVASARAERQQS